MDKSELTSGQKRKLSKLGFRKPPKHVARVLEDGRVLHPTKGFLPQSRNRNV